MASPLPPEQEAAYSIIIDRILASSDLNTVSAKRIRKGLQEEVEYDLTPQKDSINELIKDRFDKVLARRENGYADDVPEALPTSNGAAHATKPAGAAVDFETSASPPASAYKRRASEDEDMSDVADSPAFKKVKKSKAVRHGDEVESDEKMAARLQAELNAQAARSTRGGGTKKKAPVKREKKAKKKSVAKINANDDSDLSGEEVAKPEKEKKGGFHKLMNLSEPLSAMLGETALSRPQTVKRIWDYVKARDLQDPSDKRQIVCDDAMRAVFKSDRVHMFTMNKLLAHHLYPVDEVE